MADGIGKLDAFLRFNERGVLADPDTVSKALAEEHAHRQFERHDEARRLREPSDFDRFVEEAEGTSGKRGERGGKVQ